MTEGEAHGCCMGKGSRDCVSHLEHFSLMTFGTNTSKSDSSRRTTVIQTDLRNEGLNHLTTQGELARFDRDQGEEKCGKISRRHTHKYKPERHQAQTRLTARMRIIEIF